MGTRQSVVVMVLGVQVALFCWGCVVSPVPEPPTLDEKRIWMELISTNPDVPDAEVDTAIIHGDAGAVTPGGALLRAVNLDLNETVRELNVEEDGSFSVALGGQPGDMFRLRAYANELWSRSVDVIAPEETGPALPAPRTLRECFQVNSPSAVDLGGVALGDIAVEVISIDNECAEDAFIDTIRLRIGDVQPPTCEEELARCQAGEGEDETGWAECQDPYRTCTADCDTEYTVCLEAMPVDECEAELETCRNERCMPELWMCCEQLFDQCSEIPYEQPQGFTALYGSLPMTVPSGSSRTIVVTFAPLLLGPAEDALIIDIVSPEFERRTITLTGRGTDG